MAGALAGAVVTFIAAVLVRDLPPANDASVLELNQRRVAMWVVAAGTCGGGLLGMALGNRRVPHFFLHFVLAFAAICLVPWWRSPKSGDLLPLGTTYVNRVFSWRSVLPYHLALAALVAVCGSGLRWTWMKKMRGANTGQSQRPPSRDHPARDG
jgi:hypothetical protein